MMFHCEELIESAENTNSNASGGFINQYGQEYIVRATGRSKNPEEIGQFGDQDQE